MVILIIGLKMFHSFHFMTINLLTAGSQGCLYNSHKQIQLMEESLVESLDEQLECITPISLDDVCSPVPQDRRFIKEDKLFVKMIA